MLRTALDESPSLVLMDQLTVTSRTPDEKEIRAEDVAVLKRQLQQAELVSREALLYAREVIQDARELVIRKGCESNDNFLRYHLNVAANEVALLMKSFDHLCDDRESPCFSHVLSSETSMAMNRFPTRFSPNIRAPRRMSFVPSKSAEAIFSHALRYLLRAAAQCETRNKSINVWLDQKEDVVMLHLDNIRVSNVRDFLLHVSYPRRIRTLLSALHARLECSPQGVTAYIPVEACL
jgi:hypothetical protein